MEKEKEVDEKREKDEGEREGKLDKVDKVDRVGPQVVQLSRTANLGPLVFSDGDTEVFFISYFTFPPFIYLFPFILYLNFSIS